MIVFDQWGVRMRKKERSVLKQKQILMIAVAAVGILVLILGIVSWRKSVREKEKIQKGLTYLESLENKDIVEINAKVKKVKKEQNQEYVSENEDEVWSGFEDAMIIGDSRAVGFSYYGFLAEEQVYAEKGALITSIKEYIPQIKAYNPGQVYICFGLNDLQSGQWSEPEDYSKQCAEIIELLNNEIPQCEVYLNSILPTSEEKMESDPVYSSITKYNDSMKQMCEEKGYNFVDNTEMAQSHLDLYEIDGLHLESDFYKYWAMNMLLEVK